jgi:hypothetical protein
MIQQRKVIMVLIGVLVLCATLHADMMLSLRQDSGYAPSLSVCDRAVLQHTSWPSPFDCPGVTNPDFLPVKFLSISNDDVGQTREAKPVQLLADGQSSFSLCLSALLGVALCRSVPLVKRLHFGCLPEWYYRGGPSQIGNSLAISPDCLCSAPVYCFIPPDATVEDCLPRYYRGTIVSLLRRAEFTPTALAPRGPPYGS